jgi:hypothetical protein
MTLPTAIPHVPDPVGAKPGDGDASRGGVLAVLNFAQLKSPIEWMRYCPTCLEETCFVAEIELTDGLYGYCARCGEWRKVPFTRTVEE